MVKVKTISIVNKKTGGKFVIPRFARCSSTRRNHCRNKFNKCLRSIAVNQNARKLLTRELVLISRLLRPSEVKLSYNNLPLSSKRRGRRKDVLSLGVPAECLRDSLRELFAILQINNSSMLVRTKEALLLEAQETFLRNFVNCLEFDKDNNVEGSSSFLIHWLVERNELTMLRSLLDRNVNMDQCDFVYGQTPFYIACHMANEEMVAMFMYYNVSPNAPSEETMAETFKLDRNLICAAAHNDNILETLIEYAHDQWSDIDINILMKLMQNKSRHLLKFVEMQHTNFSPTSSIICDSSSYSAIWDSLYRIPNSYLKEILVFFTKNKEAFDKLMSFFGYDYWDDYWSEETLNMGEERDNFFENLHALANTVYVGEGADGPKSTFLRAVMDKIYHRFPLVPVMSNFTTIATDDDFEVPLDEIESIMLVLLSNGAPMDDYTMELIFEHFGDLKFFNFCRSLHVMSYPYFHIYHASKFYHKFPGGRTMWQVVSDPAQSEGIESNIDYYTDLSSHPNVKEIAYRVADSVWYHKCLKAKVDRQPEFPTLLELARDAARSYIVEEYRVTRGWQFYEAVKALEIPEKLKRIIEYDMDTPLYR